MKKEFEEFVRKYAGQKDITPAPLALTFRFFLAKKQRRSDLDGLVEPFLNAFKGHLLADDIQVVELHAYRERVASDPKIEICLEVLEDTEKVAELVEQFQQLRRPDLEALIKMLQERVSQKKAS